MRHISDSAGQEMIEIFPDADQLARAAAEHLVALAEETMGAERRFAVALAGGSTPKAMYRLLAGDEYARRVDWSQVHVFWGDERCVPPDHPDSNYRMARQAWLDHVPLPMDNVHRIEAELEPTQAAMRYERVLRDFFSPPAATSQASDEATPTHFNLVLLGMGDDGHTASLFPGTAAIDEGKRWVVAHHVDKLGAWRITLTPAIINAAANVTFIVSGAAKAERLEQVLNGPYQPQALPAQIIRPEHGRLFWLLDPAAAACLRGE